MAKKLKRIDVRDVTQRVVKDYNKDREYQQNKKIIAYEERQRRYNQSGSGKVSRGIVKGLSFLRRPSATLYKKSIRPQPLSYNRQGVRRTVSGASQGRRGRPVGSYDSRYAQYGGVYGYRKMLNAQLRQQRMESLRRATINPQQQQVLNQIERREQIRRQSPESKTIPDTAGNVFMSDIMRDINDASNMVG